MRSREINLGYGRVYHADEGGWVTEYRYYWNDGTSTEGTYKFSDHVLAVAELAAVKNEITNIYEGGYIESIEDSNIEDTRVHWYLLSGVYDGILYKVKLPEGSRSLRYKNTFRLILV